MKIAENGIDYSLTSTLRQALFLPPSREVKYEGKTAIDTFFWRFGDLIQGGATFVGINVFGFSVQEVDGQSAEMLLVSPNRDTPKLFSSATVPYRRVLLTDGGSELLRARCASAQELRSSVG